ncbi:zf-HC2 domain-containing protein [candidate division WOR-3 bacterium]|nr:zf-HC2 domain-containing protein [candidate division WOR-3 bacterium]
MAVNCDEVKRSLQDYVTRELAPEDRRVFDAHLVECGECQRELALMTAVVSTLDHQPVLEPRPGFSEKVMRSLPRQRVFLLSPWWSLVLAPLLAGLVWLFRGQAARVLEAALSRSGLSQVTVPTLSLQQAGIAGLAVVLVGLAVAVGAGAYAWQVYLRD